MRTLIFLRLLIAATLCFSLLPLCLAQQKREHLENPGGTYAEWLHYSDTLRRDPEVVRYYAFDSLRNEADPVSNLAGDHTGPLTFHLEPAPNAPQDTFQLVPGRWSEKKAVRLDQGYLVARAPEVTGNAFTATLWFRKLGQGAYRGNDGTANGMLLATGNGYYEGWRLTTAYPSRKIGFEIGRPQGSFGLNTADPIADGSWHHLAATWDGHTMCVYVDGELAGQSAFTGPYTPPANGEFRIGFAGSGVGSTIMDVDEAVIYRRALSAEEVFRDAYFYENITDAQMLQRATAEGWLAQKRYVQAEEAFKALLQSPGLHRDFALAVQLRLIDLMRLEARPVPAARELNRILDIPDLPGRLHKLAMEKLTTVLLESAGAAIPVERTTGY